MAIQPCQAPSRQVKARGPSQGPRPESRPSRPAARVKALGASQDPVLLGRQATTGGGDAELDAALAVWDASCSPTFQVTAVFRAVFHVRSQGRRAVFRAVFQVLVPGDQDDAPCVAPPRRGALQQVLPRSQASRGRAVFRAVFQVRVQGRRAVFRSVFQVLVPGDQNDAPSVAPPRRGALQFRAVIRAVFRGECLVKATSGSATRRPTTFKYDLMAQLHGPDAPPGLRLSKAKTTGRARTTRRPTPTRRATTTRGWTTSRR